jgi:hypothetical protein
MIWLYFDCIKLGAIPQDGSCADWVLLVRECSWQNLVLVPMFMNVWVHRERDLTGPTFFIQRDFSLNQIVIDLSF